jgi:hypothetical protein
VVADELFTTETPLPHSHVKALLGVIPRLAVDTLLVIKRSCTKDLLIAMIVERLIRPCSKVAMLRTNVALPFS